LLGIRKRKSEDGSQRSEGRPSYLSSIVRNLSSDPNLVRKRDAEHRKQKFSLPSSVFRHLSSDLKRPVLLQTHPGSLRSGSDHDWYARTRTTEDGKQKTEKVTPLRRCLTSPIIRQTGCASSSRCQVFKSLGAKICNGTHPPEIPTLSHFEDRSLAPSHPALARISRSSN
jgi:hypothetical protein